MWKGKPSRSKTQGAEGVGTQTIIMECGPLDVPRARGDGSLTTLAGFVLMPCSPRLRG